MQDDSLRAAIAALGNEIGPDVLHRVHDLFNAEQQAIARALPPRAVDMAYGEHPRQRLDVYAPQASDRPVPILLWVHGGGFLRGDKGDGGRWQDAHAGRFAARAGLVGAVMNYRLAPDHQWPAGGEDVGAAVDWLQENGAQFGGDPDRIILVGTSAGAVHVATCLQLRPQTRAVKGAVFLSGLYGFTPLDGVRDAAYYGKDSRLHADRLPLDAVVETDVPLLVSCCQFDPPRFQAEFVGLLERRLARHGRLPHSYIASGHNHFSIAYHLGTADTRLSDEILGFTRNL